jgi:hypothetical protein
MPYTPEVVNVTLSVLVAAFGGFLIGHGLFAPEKKR